MTPELLEKLAGRKVIASVSGGKDSAALSLWLTEQGVEHERVFMDTGWEHAITYDYLRGDLTRAVGPIRELRSSKTMVEWIRHKGMFPSRAIRWCTEELKVKPLRAYLDSLAGDVVNTVGIRGEESAKRAAMTEWEWSPALDCETWRPLISWTFAQVVEIHRRHGLRPNPLYLLGAERVGCWPCVNERKAGIRLIAEMDPARLVQLGALEREISERRGSPRAFFNGKTSRGSVAPIEDVARWAAGDKRQLPIFLEDESPGCMRWGLCDTGSTDPEANHG